MSLKIVGEPPVILNIFPKAGFGKIRPMTAKECRNINYDAAFGNKVNCNYNISALSWGGGGGVGLLANLQKRAKRGGRMLQSFLVAPPVNISPPKTYFYWSDNYQHYRVLRS